MCTVLYVYYDAGGVAIYAGITDDLAARTAAHAARSTWLEFATRRTLTWFADRRVASEEEANFIRENRPVFNRAHNGTGRDQEVVAYLVRAGRLDLLDPAIDWG